MKKRKKDAVHKTSGGFTAAKVGLTKITAKFGEDRDGCPHKGTDFGSGGVEKDFKAGVSGKVVAPVGGDWGTITIKPDHDSTVTLQYLHCSSIAVKEKDKVTKDTILGKTGKKAPAGTNITGIHLHLQVYKNEDPAEACWNTPGRNFIDPETWDTSS
ncbi:Peptidase family M23 [compost metagenome]